MGVTKTMDERFGQLTARVEADMARLDVPGASVGVWHKGERRIASFGITSVENPLPVTPDTLFQIGSISKTMTSTGIMRLVEDGRLDLDQPLRERLPGFRMSDPKVTAKATLRHLLTHTGGWVGDYFDDFGNGDDALAAMVAAVGRLPQVTPLGAFFSYNNAGYNIAGRLLEVAAGQPYETAMKNLVFDPIGLDNAWFYPDDVMITKRFVAGHGRREGRTVVSRPWAVGRAGNCVGGCVCSVENLLDYARFYLARGVNAAGERVMRAETIDAMLEPRLEAGVGKRLGLTWNIRNPGGIKFCGHGGSTHGHEAALHFAPEEDFAIALLTNSSSGSVLTDSLLDWGLDLWFGVQSQGPDLKPAPGADLAAYAGRYELPLLAFTLEVKDGGFVLQDIPKGGFPNPTVPPGEADPPVRARLCADDRMLCLDEPRKGAVGEFFRGKDGKVAYCRLGGRVLPKVD